RPISRCLALLVPVALLVAACGSDDDSGSPDTTAPDGGGVTAPEGLVSDGTLTVCSDTPYEPFEFKDDAGEDTGYDMDLLRAIGSSADLELSVIDLPFDGILGSLEAGDCDVVASAVTITEERAQQVDFSDPYFDADQSLLIKADQAGEITSLADLDGSTVGVQSGTTGETYANENATGAEVKSFEDSDGLFAALESGDIVAILQDLPVNGYRSTQDDTVVVIETYPTEEQYGFAVKKGNTSMLDFLNTGLTTLRDDGTFDEIYASYFGDPEG
ncbi:MAG: basic amino acid ABC transporter substrate-binding protein, partial [Acidimicrobiales bacterium]